MKQIYFAFLMLITFTSNAQMWDCMDYTDESLREYYLCSLRLENKVRAASVSLPGYTSNGTLTTTNLGAGLSIVSGLLNVDDQSATNELQTLSYNSGTGVLGISGGNTLTLPTAIYTANVTVSQTAVVALLGGVRKVTITGATGINAGDRVLLTPTGSTPAGYALGDVVATAANTLEVSFTAPALALGASFSIPCKVTVFR